MPRRQVDPHREADELWTEYWLKLHHKVSGLRRGHGGRIFSYEHVRGDDWDPIWVLGIARTADSLAVELLTEHLSAEQELRLLDESWAPRPFSEDIMLAAWDTRPGNRDLERDDLHEACDLVVGTLRGVLSVVRPKDLEANWGEFGPFD